MQSELKPCPFCSEQCAMLVIDQGDKWAHYEPSCLEVRTGYDLSDDATWRAEAIAAWNTRASDAEITRLTEALRAAEKLLAEIKGVSDVILAPICAASGRYIYDWAACPDMIEELYAEDVCIPAKAFHDLYMATNYDIVVLAQALAGAKP